MAQVGYTPLILYSSNTASAAPLAANLNFGELALNYADGKIFYKNASGVVSSISNGVTTFQTSLSGLTPSTSTSGAVTLAGTLGATSGGTGLSTYATGDLIYASAANTLSKLTAGTNGYVLTLAGGVPVWQSTGTVTSVAFSTGTTGLSVSGSPITTSGTITLAGTLGIANGGTGQTTATAAFDALAPSQTGNSGKVLSTNGTTTSWISISGSGTVTSVAVSGGTTGLTTSGGPITGSGTITLAGTLGIANGGTGQITATAAFDALAPTQTGNSGKYLTTNGTTTSWGSVVSSITFGTTGLTPSTASTGAVTVAGTLGLANGGTGQTTASAAFNALSPITTTGDLIIGNGTNSATRLAIGLNTYVLTSNGTTASWAAPASGGVTTVSFGSTGLTPSTATAGAITVAGTLAVANGGTGVTSSTGTGSNVLNNTPSLTNPTVTEYTETNFSPAAGTAFTISLANGTFQNISLNGNGTITLPSSVAGKSYVIKVTYSGAFTLSWAGGSTLKWPGAVAPTATSANGKFDMFAFFCDGTNTYGQSIGLNY